MKQYHDQHDFCLGKRSVTVVRTVYYSDGYEEVSDDSLGNYSITYLGENIIGVKKNNAVTYYYMLTDHQGSVVGIIQNLYAIG